MVFVDNGVPADVEAATIGAETGAVVAGGATTLPLLKLTFPKADETVDIDTTEEVAGVDEET